jgi:hypothetical protein
MATDVPNPVVNSALKLCGTKLFVSHDDTEASFCLDATLLLATVPASTFLITSLSKPQREASFLICTRMVSEYAHLLYPARMAGGTSVWRFLNIVVWNSSSCQ